MLEQEIAEIALQNLAAHTGVIGHWQESTLPYAGEVDGHVSLDVNGSKLSFTVEVKREFRDYHMDRLLDQSNKYGPMLLIADRLFPAQKAKLRQHQISYVDTAGNAYIKAGEVFLWIEGQKAVYEGIDAPKANRAFTKAGLKVVFALLQNQEAINFTYRDLAELSDVSLGTINEAFAALKEAGYLLRVNKDRMLLDNKKQLFENWLTGYGNLLKPSLLVGSFQFRNIDNWKSLPLPIDTVWGGEPAADLATGYLSPEQWTVYVSGSKNEVAKALQLIPKQGGNLKIFKKFWKDFPVDKLHFTAPELLTYADLLLTGEPRCIETARIIYEEKLIHSLEN